MSTIDWSKAPPGSTHYKSDWHCASTGGIQYYKLDRAGWSYWGETFRKGWVECNQPIAGFQEIPEKHIAPATATPAALRSKACDEMFGAILNLPEDRRHNRSDIVEALYDAGYRKFEIVDGEA